MFDRFDNESSIHNNNIENANKLENREAAMSHLDIDAIDFGESDLNIAFGSLSPLHAAIQKATSQSPPSDLMLPQSKTSQLESSSISTISNAIPLKFRNNSNINNNNNNGNKNVNANEKLSLNGNSNGSNSEMKSNASGMHLRANDTKNTKKSE